MATYPNFTAETLFLAIVAKNSPELTKEDLEKLLDDTLPQEDQIEMMEDMVRIMEIDIDDAMILEWHEKRIANMPKESLPVFNPKEPFKKLRDMLDFLTFLIEKFPDLGNISNQDILEGVSKSLCQLFDIDADKIKPESRLFPDLEIQLDPTATNGSTGSHAFIDKEACLRLISDDLSMRSGLDLIQEALIPAWPKPGDPEYLEWPASEGLPSHAKKLDDITVADICALVRDGIKKTGIAKVQ
jgi:hypothetical protein